MGITCISKYVYRSSTTIVSGCTNDNTILRNRNCIIISKEIISSSIASVSLAMYVEKVDDDDCNERSSRGCKEEGNRDRRRLWSSIQSEISTRDTNKNTRKKQKNFVFEIIVVFIILCFRIIHCERSASKLALALSKRNTSYQPFVERLTCQYMMIEHMGLGQIISSIRKVVVRKVPFMSGRCLPFLSFRIGPLTFLVRLHYT